MDYSTIILTNLFVIDYAFWIVLMHVPCGVVMVEIFALKKW